MPQYAVLRQIVDLRQRLLDGTHQLGAPGTGAGADLGIESCLEQLDQPMRDRRVRSERRFDERLRERKPDLAQIFRVGAENHDFGGGQPSRQHQTVEIVVLDLAAENGGETLLEHPVHRVDLDLGIGEPR